MLITVPYNLQERSRDMKSERRPSKNVLSKSTCFFIIAIYDDTDIALVH